MARKLDLPDFGNWIELELNGYSGESKIPSYRSISGQMKAFHPHHGWTTASFDDPEIDELVSNRSIDIPISEIESVMKSKQPGSTLHLPLGPAHQKMLRDSFEVQTEFALVISPGPLASILDTVRTTILKWSLELEKDGVVGDGLTFTVEEKSAANQSNYNINNYFGDVSSAQIQQGTVGSTQFSATGTINLDGLTNLLQQLREILPELCLEEDAQRELAAELETVTAQTNSPKPKKRIISESMQTVRRILEGASGSAAGHLIVEIGKYVF